MNINQGDLSEYQDRTAFGFIRQSTIAQLLNNLGSGDVQLGLRQEASQLGWAPEKVEIIDARGESGSRGAKRQFNRLLEVLRRGEAGALLLTKNDRLSRKALDSQRIMEAAEEHGTLIMVDGRPYRMNVPADKFMMGILAQVAEYENESRAENIMRARLALAQRGAQMIPLPVGLVWASPSDPTYLERIEAAGLIGWIERLEEHKTGCRSKGNNVFVLPYPDAEVFAACAQRVDVLLAEQDLNAVVRHIHNDDAYPRPGMIPVPAKGKTVRWVHAGPSCKDILRAWFKSPAVAGTYQFVSKAMAKRHANLPSETFRVTIEDAFPSFVLSAEAPLINAALRSDRKPWKRGSWTGKRPHMLEGLRCDAVKDDGSTCKRKIIPVYESSGAYVYTGNCEGHASNVEGRVLDHALQTILLDALAPAALSAALERLEINYNGGSGRVAQLEHGLAEAGVELDGLTAALAQAHVDAATPRKIFVERKIDELLMQQRRLASQLADAQASLAAFEEFAKSDREQIIGLGRDFEELCSLARASDPEILRRLMAGMLAEVRFRRLTAYAGRLIVSFPGGAIAERTVLTKRLSAPRASIEYAAAQVRAGVPPSEIARTLDDGPHRKKRVPWDVDRVLTASILLEGGAVEALPAGRYVSLQSLIEEGADPAELFLATIRGLLGPGYYADNDLHIRPTLRQLHRNVRSAGRAYASRAKSWPIADVIAAADAGAIIGSTRAATAGRARRRSGVVKDASGRLWMRRSDFLGHNARRKSRWD